MTEFLEMPGDWKKPKEEEFQDARVQALRALSHPRLSDYYDAGKNYAGTSFWRVGTNQPGEISPDDLLAITLLSVRVGPHGVRALLDDGDTRSTVHAALKSVSDKTTLAEATADDLVDGFAFHAAVKTAIANPRAKKSNPWVTASKIAARKRPHLLPVRDNVVGNLLGKRAVKFAGVYYQLMRALLLDPEVKTALAAVRRRVASTLGGQLQDGFDEEPDLRLLDAALWIYAIDTQGEKDPHEKSGS